MNKSHNPVLTLFNHMFTVTFITTVDLILPFVIFFTGTVCKDHYSKTAMTNGLSDYEVQVLVSKRYDKEFQ